MTAPEEPNSTDYLRELQRKRMLVELCKHLCAVELILWRLERIDAVGRPQDGFGRRQAFAMLQTTNDAALIMHLARAWRWLGLVKQHNEAARDFGQRLGRISQAIRVLRDKREHSDEYLDPKKAEPFVVLEQVGPNAFMDTPPEWSSSIGGIRKLGGRLAVRDIGPAVRELSGELVAAELWPLYLSASDMIAAEARLHARSPNAAD